MNKKILTINDFSRTQNIPGSLSQIASYQVPQDTVIEGLTQVPLKIKIASYQQFTGVAANASFSVTTSYPIAPLVNSQSAEPYLNLIAHAYDVTAGKDLGAPTAVNFSTSQLTFAGNSSAGTSDTIDVFYLSTVGSIQIYKQVGTASSTRTLWLSEALATLNTLDPYNYNSAPYFDRPYLAGDLDLILVFVNSPSTIVMNSLDAPASLPSNVSVGMIDLPFNVYTGVDEIRALFASYGVKI